MEHVYTEAVTSCPSCGRGDLRPTLSARDHLVSHHVFQLTTCANCGLCLTNPRPSRTEIGQFYRSDAYISHTNSRQGLSSRIYQQVRRYAIRSKYRMIRKQEPSGHILDIGCGTGEFLAYLKSRGYTPQGVEPDLRARTSAIAEHALDVVPQLEAVPAQEQFDVITLWHVLEHMHDPVDTTKKIHARSKPGGSLVIAVPDRESWDARHYGADWAAYDVPRHLSHFRRQDIRRLLHAQGFQLVRTRRMWFDAPYVCMLSEQHRGAGPLRSLIKGVFWGILSNAVALTGARPTSSTLFFARKR